MIDGHVHLEKGPITIEYVFEFIEAAKKAGITKLQILDHTHRFKEFSPIYQNIREAHPLQKEWIDKKELVSLLEFHKVIEEVKNRHLDIEVTFGLEVCYAPEYKSFLGSILNQYPYDFLVGAIHSIDGLLYDMPFSKETLWEKQDINNIYHHYYALIFNLVSSNLFTQLAHPDTIKMFNYYPNYDLVDTYHQLSELLKIHHVKAENNTGCFYRYNHKDIGLSNELLEIFKLHHVEMITASDAHYPKHVGMNIKDIHQKTME